MLKLHHYVLRHLIIMTVFSILAVGISGYFVLKHLQLDHYERELKSLTEAIKIPLEEDIDLASYVKEFYNKTDIRISVFDDNGNVVADSQEGEYVLDNHNNREEIMKARGDDYGISLRYSSTLKRDFLYVATTFKKKGENFFLRVSIDTKAIMRDFYIMWANVTAIFTIFLIAGFFWADSFSKKIRNEIDKINTSFGALALKQYDQEIDPSFAKEFYEIGDNIKILSKRLEKREKQKRKYTARIKFLSQQKSDVISAISHEFKNPIATIMGYAQTLEEGPNLDIEVRKKFLERIVRNAQKISDMIDRFSLSIKFESGELKPNLKDFDFNEMAKEIVESFTVSNPTRTIRYSGEKTMISADEQMMEQVVINLVQNAIKYSEVDIEISLKDRVFSVQDFGIGIDKDEISKITSKFYRSNAQTWDNSMGLGLFFVSSILKLHKTQLQITSEVNEGSTFFFTLI